jgi:predicted nucleic acid-binding protein
VNLLDSSAWIETLVRGPRHAEFEPLLGDPKRVLVPAVVVYEVSKWAQRAGGHAAAWAVTQLFQDCQLVPLEPHLAQSAAEISIQHRLAMADSMILATARAHQATIWTMDADLQSFPGVEYRPR